MPRGPLLIVMKLYPYRDEYLKRHQLKYGPSFVLEARQSRSAQAASVDLAEIVPIWPRLQDILSGNVAYTIHRVDHCNLYNLIP
jgi:hypothetical protein